MIRSPLGPSLVHAQKDAQVMTLNPQAILQYGTSTTTTPITPTTASLSINGLISFNQVKQEVDVGIFKITFT